MRTSFVAIVIGFTLMLVTMILASWAAYDRREEVTFQEAILATKTAESRDSFGSTFNHNLDSADDGTSSSGAGTLASGPR